MKKRIAILGLLLLASGSSAARAQATEVIEKHAGPSRVLVLPRPSEAFAAELSVRAGAIKVDIASSKAGSLKELREDAAALDAIRAGGWDFVVLTGHPTFGKTLVIDGELRVGDSSELLHHGRLLLEEIRRSGTRPIVLVPPAGPRAPAMDQEALEWAYQRLGREGGALLAPVGDGFSRVRRRRPGLALFDPHGEGWSPAGAYLAAAVLESTITGRPPGGTAAPADEPSPDDPVTGEARRLLDGEAWGAVRDLAAAGGSRDLPAPPFPAVPILPRGQALTAASLQGTWRGPLQLYPWPATLELEVVGSAGSWQVSGRLRSDGGGPGRGFQATDVRLESDVFSFRNPSDLADGRTLYRLVVRGDRLLGVAELTTDDGAVYAVGGLELERLRARSTARTP